MAETSKTVAIIGAGPVGLAAAAHALQRNLTPIVLEAGPTAGHAVKQWSHVQMFSPWAYNVDKAAERLLLAAGWNAPDPAAYPTGGDFVARYIEPLARRTPLERHIRTCSRVTAISRIGFDKAKTAGRSGAPFEVRYMNGKGAERVVADAVIDASGTWFSPNPTGANGLPAIGESACGPRIAYGMPDVLGASRSRYAGKSVAVLGAGHSAIGTLIDLVRLSDEAPATTVTWLLRGDRPEKAFGGGANDKLAARGALGSRFAQLVEQQRLTVETAFGVTHLGEVDGRLRIGAGSACCGRHVVVDELVVAAGFRPDHHFLSELRLALDPALDCPTLLGPLIDPNEHSCGTVRPHGARELSHPETGFYIAGMKSYGRAPTFLTLTGYEQVRSIIADIAGDEEAAARVELLLPETGVCSRAPNETAGRCCGGDTAQLASISASRERIGQTEARECCGGVSVEKAKSTACCG